LRSMAMASAACKRATCTGSTRCTKCAQPYREDTGCSGEGSRHHLRLLVLFIPIVAGGLGRPCRLCLTAEADLHDQSEVTQLGRSRGRRVSARAITAGARCTRTHARKPRGEATAALAETAATFRSANAFSARRPRCKQSTARSEHVRRRRSHARYYSTRAHEPARAAGGPRV
jgi:hypothetical protein